MKKCVVILPLNSDVTAVVKNKKAMAPRHHQDHIETFKVGPGQAAKLLEFLFESMPQRSKTTVKSLLRYNRVKINDTVSTHFDAPLKAGDIVAVNHTQPWPSLKNPRVRVLYEDDDVIVVEKGYGLLSVGTDKKSDGTCYSIVKDYLKRVHPSQKLFVVHRLDQHTSGVMVFAKNEAAKNTLQHNWNNMVLERRYLAVVEGRPERSEGVIKSYLLENSQHIVYSTQDPESGGRLAVTRWRLLRSRGGYSLLDVSLDTGRKNQIRVHLKDIGHPIAGDRKYGAKTSPMHRLGLHAESLRFVHPVTRKDMNFSVPMPPAFNKIV